MRYDPTTFRLVEHHGWVRRLFFAGVGILLISLIGLVLNPAQFYHSYLVAYIFWFTVAIGGLFFILLHHLTGSVWSVVLRRIVENIVITLPLLLILFIPILIGLGQLYHWNQADLIAQDHLLQKKTGFLNAGFFTVRTIIYFTVWLILGMVLYRKSVQQDTTSDSGITQRLKQISAPGMILFAFTLTFASFDWIMSLDAHWYSTIFGVYIFSGSYLALLAFLILLLTLFRRSGVLTEVVTEEHLYDLGKLLFAFTVFWAYIAGAQYFLIWYGNIPEETVWYLHRWEGTWKAVSFAIIILHFAVPFVILLFRRSKRSAIVLPAAAALVFVAHLIDLYWLVMPTYHHHEAHFSWLDLTCWVGLGSLFVGTLIWLLGRQPLVPVGDPRLEESISAGH